MKLLLLITAFLLLFAVEILRVYFIMPFPGSQHNNTIDIAYWISRNIMVKNFSLIAFSVSTHISIKAFKKIEESCGYTSPRILYSSFLFFQFSL